MLYIVNVFVYFDEFIASMLNWNIYEIFEQLHSYIYIFFKSEQSVLLQNNLSLVIHCQ